MKIIIANLKMNPTNEKEAEDFFNFYSEQNQRFDKVNLIVAPPYVYLKLAKEKGLEVAAQNCFYKESGAYTGEISPLMLKDLGVEYVIVGHSERREMGETNEMIAKKVKAVLENKLIPILCVGEKKEELNQKEEIIKEQLKQVFSINVSNRIIIAYEPRWAIGTGDFCDPQKADDVHRFIKEFLKNEFGITDSIVLYGGSVDGQNIESFLNQKNIDGALVGGASLKKEEFAKILEIANSK
ncbi:MAG: triose-phosphate isomerase [Minisyncoccia bacterium]